MAGVVPQTKSLKDIYLDSDLNIQQQRWQNLVAAFESRYGSSPQFISRSPGRVNLIGEHIDYSLYEVMPMAITADVLLAVSTASGDESRTKEKTTIRISNINDAKFPSRQIDIPCQGDVEIDSTALEWSNYFLAGLRGALGWLRRKKTEAGAVPPASMDILVDGSVPAGAGLSSSSAFVCASALAVLKANGEQAIDKKELVEMAIVSERLVGVNSGGMDQSASVFAQRSCALFVAFKPALSALAVEFPRTSPELTFLVAQSLVAADKHVTAPVCYNLRVVECSLASRVLASLIGLRKPLPPDESPLGVSLRGLQEAYFDEKASKSATDRPTTEELRNRLQIMLGLSKTLLTNVNGYTRQEIGDMLGQPVDELETQYMAKCPVRAERFHLRQRAVHVFSEAIRVLDFKAALSSPEEESSQTPARLGDLMNQSQSSCRDLFDCSCPELDEICHIALRAGAYGSRLTGAGWGGSTVHLVPQEKVEDVREALELHFYRKRFPAMTKEQLADAIVVSKPANGSFVLELTGNQVQ